MSNFVKRLSRQSCGVAIVPTDRGSRCAASLGSSRLDGTAADACLVLLVERGRPFYRVVNVAEYECLTWGHCNIDDVFAMVVERRS